MRALVDEEEFVAIIAGNLVVSVIDKLLKPLSELFENIVAAVMGIEVVD